MPLFIVTGLLGLLFFLGSLVFGDHEIGGDGHDFGGDHDHGGPSIISVFNVAWFLIGFGGTGTLLRAQDVSMPISTVSGMATGAVCWGLAFFVMHLLTKQQGESSVTLARIMDTVGTVVISIPANGVGKIQCSVSGSSQEFLARSADAVQLPEGSRVRITSDCGGVYTVKAV